MESQGELPPASLDIQVDSTVRQPDVEIIEWCLVCQYLENIDVGDSP